MRVSIDVDGVVKDFDRAWRHLYWEWFGIDDQLVPVDPAWLMTWDDYLTLTHFEDANAFFTWFDRADGWAKCDWIPGARGSIDFLYENGLVAFNTARQTDAAKASIKADVLALWPMAVLDTNRHDKTLTRADVHIDDAPLVAEQFRAVERQMILFTQPWNSHVDQDEFITRADSWSDVISIIEERYL